MFIQLKKYADPNRLFLCLSFLIGLIPASFIIHIIPVDFSGFYFQALSFLNHHQYAYQYIQNYCNNPLNSGLNARAPLVPFLLAGSIALFGRTLLGILLPFFLARLFVTPLTYLVAKHFLPERIAFLSALLTVFIPKLQTYSLGAPEADVFVTVFYIAALYFYLKSQLLQHKNYALLTGVMLGLGALSKSTGLGIAVGFLLGIGLETLLKPKIKKSHILKNFFLLTFSFLLLIGPYLLWTLEVHKQLYITTQHDRSLSYIPKNLPSLLITIPLYLGIRFDLGLKASLVSAVLLSCLIWGIYISLAHKNFSLTFPTVLTVLFISMLETCIIGYNIPANTEFITILGFSMLPTTILFFMGAYSLITIVWSKMFHKKTPQVIISIVLLMIMYKFIANYFTARYSFVFTGNEYYISLPTVVKNRAEIHNIIFAKENGLLMFKGPPSHRLIREQFQTYKFDPFSPFYLRLLFSVSIIALFIFLFSPYLQKDKTTIV